MDGWKDIADENVLMLWKCENEHCEAPEDERVAELDPTFYQESGTPVCECDEEMTYIKTMVKI